jgi:hypothetical protein
MNTRNAKWAATAVVLGTLFCMAPGGREQLFKGEIADSQCANNVHSLDRSHAEMLKKKAVGKTAADCTRYCVKYMGGLYVIEVGQNVYKLDNQELADKYAGEQVKLVGVLDPSTKTIAVRSIEPLNASN